MRKEFLEKGIIVIPSVFTPMECSEIKRQAYAVRDEDIVSAGYPHVPSEQMYNKKSLIFFPSLCNEYLNSIRIDNRMVELVREFVGDDVRQINNQIYFREKGDLDEFAWHQDTIFREPNIFNGFVESDYFQTIVAVDDINDENGAIEFIEGSHLEGTIHRPPHLREFIRGDRKGTKYKANRGDVLIWSIMIVHGSERNTSGADRMTYMNGFCKTRAASSYPHYLIGGKIIPRIDPTMIP